MNERHVFYCDNTLEGIFSGVYQAWDARVGHGCVELRTEEPENMELFCVYHRVKTSLTEAEKVRRTIARQLGPRILEEICFAACADDPKKGTAIYRTLVECLSVHGTLYKKKSLDDLKNPSVRKVTELYRSVWTEYDHYLGFLRFQELPGGILAALISPRHDLLLLFQDHFSNRYPRERWIIGDSTRGKLLVHQPGDPCFLMGNAGKIIEEIRTRRDEGGDYELLFANFCESISIKERENDKLQKQNLPLRYREDMVEFHQKTDNCRQKCVKEDN